MDFPLPTYPGRKFPVTMLGIDEASYSHVHLATKETWRRYAEFLTDLKDEYCNSGELVPFEEIEEGMFVVAKVRRHLSAYYVRAVVLGKKRSNYQIYCMNVDEDKKFVVPKEQVYFACLSAQDHPKRVIKMELAGLSKFLNTDHLHQAFEQLKTHIGSNFTAELIGSENTCQPRLRLMTPEGQTLTTLIQQILYQILPSDHEFFD